MNKRFEHHLFWGPQSPLSALGCVALIILASNRFAFALVCACAVVWVYGFSALIYSGARKILPRKGKRIILLFLSSFLCGTFMIIISLLNPLLVMDMGIFLLLIPPCCLASGLFEASGQEYPAEVFSRAVLEAVVIGGVILALALIREPLGTGTLSFPGGIQGIVEITDSPGGDAFVPVRILSVSAGGLLLLGYVVALFRFFREQSGSVPRNGSVREDGQ